MCIFATQMSFADFILQHEADDPVALLLARERYPDIDLDLAVTTLEVRRRLKMKVPEWYAVPSLVYPSRLSGEQCSSSETARYKALLVSVLWREGVPPQTVAPRPLPPQAAGPSLLCGRGWPQVSDGTPSRLRVADLTGGMGVDTWAFSQVAGEVLYNEMQEGLARATELNFRELGVKNVVYRNCVVEAGKVAEVLDGFRPDVIFLDPARRAEDGRKVFLIEECQPDVLGLLPELFAASRFVLLKLSPMADITMACKRLGGHVKEVHVVASGGECKELLFLLDREWSGGYFLTAYENGSVWAWTPEEETSALPVFPESPALSGVLFEPGKALLKAGAFNLPCERFGLTKLGQHTHLYVGESVPDGLRSFGKVFDVLEIMSLGNRNIKEAGKRWPQAEVTARNVPMTSDLLRRKLGCASGGDIHLFGVRIDAASGAGNYLIVTKKQYGTD